MLICALGDLLLDVVVRLDTPLNLGADATARTRTGAGGQAANVAAWATELGAKGRLVAKRASDAAGRFFETSREFGLLMAGARFGKAMHSRRRV